MRSRYCKVCTKFHDLEAPWPKECYGHFVSKSTASINIIKDIQPYRAVAVDRRTGKIPKIGSRREHREFLRANNYIEVGNEPIRKPPEMDIPDSSRDIKIAIDQIKDAGRWK